MAILRSKKVKITALCCALPKEEKNIFDVGKGYFDEETIKKTASPIGVEKIFFAAKGQTASDLCFEAADHLINKISLKRSEIDGLIFATQTPDYPAPASSCILQDRLELSKDCFTMDINAGCPAFVNAWYIAANMIESRSCKKILILIGDTLREKISPADRGLSFIISDAASAILIESAEEDHVSTTVAKTDGSAYEALIIPAGGSRLPCSEETGIMEDAEEGNKRRKEDLYMDGMGVFTFAVKEVPSIIKETADLHGISLEDVDYFLLHQANAYMLKFIAKRAKIPMEKIPINIGKYGNTNGSTIPLLINDLAEKELKEPKNMIMSGFGIGLSWAAVAMKMGGFRCAEIIRV